MLPDFCKCFPFVSSPELMRHPALDFDTKEFGPLLENTAIDELQNQ